MIKVIQFVDMMFNYHLMVKLILIVDMMFDYNPLNFVMKRLFSIIDQQIIKKISILKNSHLIILTFINLK
jgi:hypothetical protein